MLHKYIKCKFRSSELINFITNRVVDFHRGQSDAGLRIVRWVLYRTEHERNGNMVASSGESDVGGAEGAGARGGVIENFENGAG